MTRIRIDKHLTGRDIYITGHCRNNKEARAEPILICEAVTALAQTAACNVYDSEDKGEADIIDITLKSGQAVISYITDNDTLKIGAYISCDNGGWKCVYESDDGGDELACGVTIPIRCRSVRIMICGELGGNAKLTLHGIYLDREKGSELSGKY